MIIDFQKQEQFLRSLILMSKEMHEESQFSELDYDQNVFIDWIANAMVNPNYYLGGYTIDGKLAGALLGDVSQTYFGKDKVAINRNWYVRPEFRGSLAGIKLLKDFEKWAKEQGAKRVYGGTSTKINTKGFDQIMNRLNYQVVGADYQRSF